MMAQYVEIKAANPDCLLFYRMGDFYELFFEDAEIASRALGIVLTKRGKHLGEDIPMCGVPIDRADDYLQRLIGLGHRVAVCEQMEDPAEARKRGAKSVVQARRRAPRHAGHDHRGAAARAGPRQLLAGPGARAPVGESGSTALAAVDISTGAFTVGEAAEAALAGGDRPLRAARDRRAGRAGRDARTACALARRRRAPLDAVPRETGRAGQRRAPAVRLIMASRRSTVSAPSRVPRSRPPRRRHCLYRAHADRRAPAARAARARGGAARPGDRRGDARQSRTDAHAVGRARRAACSPTHRLHGDGCRRRACWPSASPGR